MSDTFTGETYNTLCIDAEGYLVKESPEQARELLQKAISLIATRPRARSLLADTCMSMELWSEARSQLEILITLDEGNIDNNFKLAQVLEELGEYQLATDNYSVVLDDEPDHHGANVAIKRIEIRANESGVNLADIFNARRGDESGETGTDDGAGELKEGLQIFPDLPSDGLFADSEDDEENSVERLLKNIGLSDDSPEEEEDDISELLENIGVSTSQTLQSAFANSEDSDEEGFSEFQKEPESTGDAEAKKNAVRSLDEIFGTPSVAEEEVTEAEPETEKPEKEAEPETEKPEKEAEPEIEESEEEEDVSPFIPESEEKDEVESLSFNSGDTLEAIFNAPEADEPEEEEAEPEVEEPGEEETVPEVEEPEEEETVPETDGPEEEAEAPAEKEKIAVVLKQEADLSFDPWSAESRLLTVHMKSGTARVKHCMLTIYEKSIKTGVSDDEVLELFGEGTFLLNCGSQEPLIVDLKENMIIRKDAVVFHTGTITAELLDIPKNDSLYVIKEKIREKVIFKTDHPLRVILLGGNNRVFYLRTSSIMATDPEILLSHTEAPEGYTEITGFGKVYLIE